MVTLPVNVTPVACAEVTARLDRAVLCPTVAPKFTAPMPAWIVNAFAPLIVVVDPKLILDPVVPAPRESSVMSLANEIGPANT